MHLEAVFVDKMKTVLDFHDADIAVVLQLGIDMENDAAGFFIQFIFRMGNIRLNLTGKPTLPRNITDQVQTNGCYHDQKNDS